MTIIETTPTGSEEPTGGRGLKRRGLFAAACAVVAAVVLRKGAEPVEAISGTGPDGTLVIGSNDLDNTTNYASKRTQLVSGLNFSGTTVFDSNASPFQSSGSTHAAGVLGTPRGTAAGVVGRFDSNVPSGFPAGLNAGVYGVSYPTTARGVFGQHLTSGTGVLGQAQVGGIGVQGVVPQFGGTGVQGVIPPTNTESAIAVYGLNYSTYVGPGPGAGGFGVYGLSAKGHGLVGAVAAAGAAAVVGATNGVANAYAAAFYGPVIVGGAFTVVNGPKSAAVPHPDGSHRRLYCMESPECWFEDFGTGRLECGGAEIPLDPDFAAIVNVDDYQVFLSEYDRHNDLCVTERTPTAFRVQAKSAEATGRFGWRAVAKRKDIVAKRLEPITIPPEPVLPTAPNAAGGPVENSA
jgi:hypothetical protein